MSAGYATVLVSDPICHAQGELPRYSKRGRSAQVLVPIVSFVLVERAR